MSDGHSRGGGGVVNPEKSMKQRYGVCAPRWMRDELRRRVDSKGVAQAARELGVSWGAVVRSIAGLQQAPGTIDRIAAKLGREP